MNCSYKQTNKPTAKEGALVDKENVEQGESAILTPGIPGPFGP